MQAQASAAWKGDIRTVPPGSVPDTVPLDHEASDFGIANELEACITRHPYPEVGQQSCICDVDRLYAQVWA